MQPSRPIDCTPQGSPADGEMAEQLIERFNREGPWDGLGDGQTFEDIIYNKFAERGVTLSEESLGRLTMEMLAQM